MADAHKKYKYAIEVRGLPETTPSSLVRQLRIILLTHKVEDFWLKLLETPGKKTRMCLITFRIEADAAYCARKFNNFKFTLPRKHKDPLITTISAKMIKNYDRSRSPGPAGIEVWNNSQGSGVYESDSLSKLDMEIEMLKRQRSVVEEERKLLMERKKIEMLMEYGQAPNLPDNRPPFVEHNVEPEIKLQPLLPLPINQDLIQNPLQGRSVILNEPIIRDDLRHRGRSPVNVQYAREVDRHEPPQRIMYNNMHTEAIQVLNPPQFGSTNVNEIIRDELKYRERSPVRQYESRGYNIAASRSTNLQPVFNSHQLGSTTRNEPERNETRHLDEIHARRDNPREYKDIHHRKPSPHLAPEINRTAFKSQQFNHNSVKEPDLRDGFRHKGRSPARNFDSREYTEDIRGRQTLPQMVPRPDEYPKQGPSYNFRRSPVRRNDSREYNKNNRRQPSPAHAVQAPTWERKQPLGPSVVKKPEFKRDDLRHDKRSPTRKHEYSKDDRGRQSSPRAIRGPVNHEIRKPIWESKDKFDSTSVRDRPVERDVRYHERSPINRRDTREYNKDIHRRQPSPRAAQRPTNEIRKPVWDSNLPGGPGPSVGKPANERDEFRFWERQNDSLEYNQDNGHRQLSPRPVQNREGPKPVWEPHQQYRPTAAKEAAGERGRERSPGRRQDLRGYDRDVYRRQTSPPRADHRPTLHEEKKPIWESNQKFGSAPIKESLTEREVRFRERTPPRRRDVVDHSKDIPRRQPSPRRIIRSANHEIRKPVWEPNQPLGRSYEKEGFGDRERMEDRRPRERAPDRPGDVLPNVNSLTSPISGCRFSRKQKKRNRLAVPCRLIVMTMSAVMEKYATEDEITKLPQMVQLAIANRLALVKQDKYISCLDDILALYRSAYPTSTDDAFIINLLDRMRTTVAAVWEPEAKQFDEFCERRMSVRAEKANLRTIIAEQDANAAFSVDLDWNMQDEMAWQGQNRGW